MTDLIRLAERVEALAGPDREVDALIAVALDLRPGWLSGADGLLWINSKRSKVEVLFAHGGRKSPGSPTAWYDSDFYEGRGLPAYTASLDAAMTLVPEGWDWIVARTNEGLTCHACVGNTKEYFGETPTLALVNASLRSLAAQRGKA